MQALKPGQIRVHLNGGESYVSPEANKHNITKSLGSQLQRIEHYKPPTFVARKTPAPAAPPIPTGKTKESLLGELLSDNKVLLPELVGWIEKSKSVEDIGIVMKGETRAGAKKAAKARINELI